MNEDEDLSERDNWDLTCIAAGFSPETAEKLWGWMLEWEKE